MPAAPKIAQRPSSMWGAIKNGFFRFLFPTRSSRTTAQPSGNSAQVSPDNDGSDSANASAGAMVTTRSQDRASQEPSSASPSISFHESSRSQQSQTPRKRSFAAGSGGKRRRLSPPEQTADRAAVLDSQASDDSGAARTLALRPHGEPDSSTLLADDARASRDGAGGSMAEEGTQFVAETQLPSSVVAGEEGAVDQSAIEESAIGEGALDSGSENDELNLPESSQSLLYRENEQVVESTQELGQITASSDYDTQRAAVGGETSAPRPETIQSPQDPSALEMMTLNGDRSQPSEVARTTNGVADAGRSKHFRFASEEPDALPPAALPAVNGHTEHAPEESDDDAAPETVTASAGQDQARTAAIEAARATQRALQEEKSKRRKRDARLKEQAKASGKPSKKPAKASKAAADPSIEAAEDLAGAILENGQLPDELPDAIFNAHAAMADRPVPAPARPAESASRKRKFDNVKDKPPKDVVRGSQGVRILPRQQMTLPPKASAQSKYVREQWLAGNRGDGHVFAQRRRSRYPLLRA